MSARAVLLLYLLFLLLERAGQTVLSALNLAHIRKNADSVPGPLRDAVDAETYRKSVLYSLEKNRFALLEGWITSLAMVAAVVSGLLGALDAAMGRLPLPPSLRGTLFVLAVFLAAEALSLPFSVFATFRIEARFGFNRTTPGLFVADLLKGWAVALVLGVPLLLGLFWFVDRAGTFWWLYAFAAFSAFQLILAVLWPLVIAPLFNRFSPLPDGALRERIEALAAATGFRSRGIFVMDAGKRSRHGNAYFTGLGRVRRIVLFDTLVESMDQEEALAILAHEIGHEKMGHVKTRLAVSVASGFLGFAALGLLLPWAPFYAAFGFAAPGPQALLVIAALCSGPVLFPLTPLSSTWSRRQEYAADRFSARAMGSGAGLRSALVRLARENLTNLSPHPWYGFFHYSHPTVQERIAALDRCH